MSEPTSPSTERHCDVVVVGGSAAGLAAALQLVRQRRQVLVVDAGEPRNGPAAHMHGFLGRDGQPPGDLIAAGRDEVTGYGGEVLPGRVERVERTGDGRFHAGLATGTSIVARRVVAAIGLVDELPDIPGVAEHWGQDVIHCPFCHGYEVRDRRLVQVITHPMGLHPSVLFRQLTDHLTVVIHEADGVDPSALDRLRADGVEVVHEKVRALITGPDGRLEAVDLTDDRRLECDVVAVGPRFGVRTEPFGLLGLRTSPHPSGLGSVVETDATGATHVAGLYAAGNVTDPSQQVIQAAADGARVGAMISFDLADEDLRNRTGG